MVINPLGRVYLTLSLCVGLLLGCPVGSWDQWLVNGGYNLVIYGIYLGLLTNHLLTIDPNFQRDI